MRVLLLNQFYPPDSAPTGLYLRDLAHALANHGHQVTVLCSRQSYNGDRTYERITIEHGVTVRRVASTSLARRSLLGKLINFASFYISLLVSLFAQRPKPDLIVALTTPPYLGLAARAAASVFRCRHAHWVMDLYPDALEAHGLLSKSNLASSVLRRLSRAQFRGALATFALGPAMAERTSAYVAKPRVRQPHSAPLSNSREASGEVEAIPLWTLGDLSPWDESSAIPLRAERNWGSSETVLLYSGNMGLGHRLGEFLAAADRLGPTGPKWAFAGGGGRRKEVERFVRERPSSKMELLDYVSAARLREHLCSADVHLASLDSAWQGVMVPSKLQGSFAVGRPVIFVGGRNNETALWILESQGGWVVPENDVDALIVAIRESMDPQERTRRGAAARAFALRHFDRVTNCDRLIASLRASPRA